MYLCLESEHLKSNGVFYLQCVLAFGETHMLLTLKNKTAIGVLMRNKEKVEEGGARLILSNFQKNRGQIFTSAFSLCEIDFQVMCTCI